MLGQRYRCLATILAGGLFFLAIFYIRYTFIDADLYQYRDDGVITMSVGRNIVDYGFVGVSPSGPIVEASSSPLQTLVYALAYLISDVGYAQYSWAQTYLTAFAIGLVFTAFFVQKPRAGLVIVGFSALGLSFFYPFFLWHASGMENALTHLFFLLSFFLLYRMVDKGRINYLYVLPLFLATIVRIESVFYIALLLIFFSVYWFRFQKNLNGFFFSVLVGLLWLGFQWARFLYFGDILPNTAYAQGISVKSKLASFLAMDARYLSNSWHTALNIFDKQGWWIAFYALPIFFCTDRTKSSNFLLYAVLVMLCATLMGPFLFGGARIDIARTSTQMTLLIFLAIAFAVVNMSSAGKRVVLIAISFPLPFLLYSFSNMQPYYLGWSTSGFERVRLKFVQLSNENDISRPLVSNPDLGAMTWYKQFNVLDLGMLGTPEMAKLPSDGSAVRKYFFRYGLPDMIEAHGYWTKKYCGSIFLTEEFLRIYEAVDGGDSTTQWCKSGNPAVRYWLRRDVKNGSQSAERQFLDSLQADLDVNKIKHEISMCKRTGASCDYIVRTTYKFIPELRRRHVFSDALALFSEPAERSLLSGWFDGQAHNAIIEALPR